MPMLNDAILDYMQEVELKWSLSAVAVTLTDLNKGQSETKTLGRPTSGHVYDDSIWCIASNSKLYTAVGLAVLVERGKLAWTDKLCDLFPDLDLQGPDQYASKHLQLQDILSHKSGIPAYLDAEFTRATKLDDTIAIINALRPTQSPGQIYQYNNIFYSLAGLLIARISGISYTDFIQKEILDLLGMTSTSFGTAIYPDKVVTPCVSLPGSGSIDLDYAFHDLPKDNMGIPAGGILSSSQDMAKWLSYLLRLVGDKLEQSDPKIISLSTFKEMLRSRTLAGEQIGGLPTAIGQTLSSEFSPPTYALGMYRCNYKGLDLAHHWGGGPGAGSIVVMLPEKGIALTVFTNMESAAYAAAPAMVLGILDRYLGLQRTDWIKRIHAMPRGRNDVAVQPPARSPTIPAPDPTYSPSVEIYRNKAFGDLYILPFETLPGDSLLSRTVAETFDKIRKATVFEHAYETQPDCYGIYQNGTLFGSYLAMFRIDKFTYWAETHYLSLPSKDTGDIRDVAYSQAAFPRGGQFRLDFFEDRMEWYKGYVPVDLGQRDLFKGHATFERL